MPGPSDAVTFGPLGWTIVVVAVVAWGFIERWWTRGLIADEVGKSASGYRLVKHASDPTLSRLFGINLRQRYRITARRDGSRDRHGLAYVGSVWGGLYSSKVEIEWDD